MSIKSKFAATLSLVTIFSVGFAGDFSSLNSQAQSSHQTGVKITWADDFSGIDWSVLFQEDTGGPVVISSEGVHVELPYSVVYRVAAELVRLKQEAAVSHMTAEDLLTPRHK